MAQQGNNNCSLKYIEGYGFDYDHTLANYSKTSGAIIYESAINYLIEHQNYPVELAKFEFNGDWAIRGLQFDKRNGIFFSLYIPLGHTTLARCTIHRKRVQTKSVPQAQSSKYLPWPQSSSTGEHFEAIRRVCSHARSLYGNANDLYGVIRMRVSESYYDRWIRDLSCHSTVPITTIWFPFISSVHRLTPNHIVVIADLFGVPETCLYCDVIEFLKQKGVEFEVEYVADDIRRAINHVHDGGVFHHAVNRDPTLYVQKQADLSAYLQKLKANNKKVFLLTNSSFDFIDPACEYLFEDVVTDMGLKHWTQVFDWLDPTRSTPSLFLQFCQLQIAGLRH